MDYALAMVFSNTNLFIVVIGVVILHYYTTKQGD